MTEGTAAPDCPSSNWSQISLPMKANRGLSVLGFPPTLYPLVLTIGGQCPDANPHSFASQGAKDVASVVSRSRIGRSTTRSRIKDQGSRNGHLLLDALNELPTRMRECIFRIKDNLLQTTSARPELVDLLDAA